MEITSWQIAVALICSPAAVVIVILYALRDKQQSGDYRQATSERLQAAAFNKGVDASIQMLGKVIDRTNRMECKYENDSRSDDCDGTGNDG